MSDLIPIYNRDISAVVSLSLVVNNILIVIYFNVCMIFIVYNSYICVYTAMQHITNPMVDDTSNNTLMTIRPIGPLPTAVSNEKLDQMKTLPRTVMLTTPDVICRQLVSKFGLKM
jgi:hypothetical protein